MTGRIVQDEKKKGPKKNAPKNTHLGTAHEKRLCGICMAHIQPREMYYIIPRPGMDLSALKDLDHNPRCTPM